MKILESQSAVLTNFEVFHHLNTHPLNNKRVQNKKQGPKDYETLKKEILQYLTTHPSPLSQKPVSYTPGAIKDLVQRLHPYELSKGEMIMIFNLRPNSIPGLNTIIEDMEDRFDEQRQGEIVAIIGEVLGQFPADHNQEQPEDTAS